MRTRDDQLIWESYKSTKHFLNEAVRALSPAEIEKVDRLIRISMHNTLAQKAPFLFHILTGLQVIKDKPNIDTMAVDGVGNIYISRAFALDELKTPGMIAGVLAHEVLHVLNSTIARQGWRNHMWGNMSLWNIVTDYVMNAQLLTDKFELPAMGLIPKGSSQSGWHIDLNELFQINSLLNISNKRCETVYDELLDLLKANGKESQPGKGNRPGGPGGGPGNPGGQAKGRGRNGDSEEGDPSDEINKNRGSGHGPWDQHIRGDASGGGEPTPMTDKELAENADRVDRAISEAQRQGMSTGNYLEPTKQHIHDWRKILRQYLDSARKVKDLTNPSLYSLSYHHYKPKKKVLRGDHIIAVIAIDTSGSMGKEQIEEIMSEIREICHVNKRLELRIMFWTEEVYLDEVVEGGSDDAFDEILALPLRPGGTKISCVEGALGDAAQDYSVVIYFTDGMVETPAKFPSAVDSIVILTDKAGDGCVSVIEEDINNCRGSSSTERVFKTNF